MKNYKLEKEVKNRADWVKSTKGRRSTLDCSGIEEEEEDLVQMMFFLLSYTSRQTSIIAFSSVLATTTFLYSEGIGSKRQHCGFLQ